MTSVFGDHGRTDPSTPVALTPAAAGQGGPDGGNGPGLDLSFFLSLGAQLGKVADSLEAEHDRRARMTPPGDEQLFTAGVYPSSGNLVLDLGSVPLGRVWQVRRIRVGGVAVTTKANGAAYPFVQGAPPNDLNLTNCVDIYTTLPAIQRYGTHQLFMLATAHLWVVVVGGSSEQQYSASADIEDWEATTFRSTFTE